MKHVARYPLPEIARRLATERACLEFLAAARWPEGRFECPRCGSGRSYSRPERLARQCANPKCGRVVSVKAGTRMEGSRQPLRAWITAAALMTKGGVSAAALQRTLRLGRYAVAHAMVGTVAEPLYSYEPEPLTGDVLAEEFMFPGGHYAVLTAGEFAEGKVRRLWLRRAPGGSKAAATGFLRAAIDRGHATGRAGPALRRRMSGGRVGSAGADAPALEQMKAILDGGAPKTGCPTQEDLNAIAFRANFRDDESGAVVHLLGIEPPKR